MAEEEEQHQPREEVEARTDTAPEPMDPVPRGNILSEPDEHSRPGEMPPPLKP